LLYDHGCNFHINIMATVVDLDLQIMLNHWTTGKNDRGKERK